MLKFVKRQAITRHIKFLDHLTLIIVTRVIPMVYKSVTSVCFGIPYVAEGIRAMPASDVMHRR